MKMLPKMLSILAACVFLAACGSKVEVPPAYAGKVLTKNGYKPDIIPPSKFRLDACWWYCDELIVVELSDSGLKESFQLFMPKDELNMTFDIHFTMSLRNDKKSINSMYARVPPERIKGWQVIGAKRVYNTYGKPILRNLIRKVVANYTISEIMSSREKINAELYAEISAALEGTPISVKVLAFGNIQPPKVIVDAKVRAAERRAAIQQAEANKQVVLVNMQTELEKAKAQRGVRRERALAAKEENRIFSESVTDNYLKYKSLEVLEAMAKNSNTVFVPYGALDTLGLSQRIFSSKKLVTKGNR